MENEPLTRPEGLDIDALLELAERARGEKIWNIAGSPAAYELSSAARTAIPELCKYVKQLEARVKPGVGRWLEEYYCACTNVTSKRSEALGYCPTHGEDRRRIICLGEAVPVGLSK